VGGKVLEQWSASNASPFLELLAQETRERERLEQELEVARRIQQASLPKEVPTLEEWQISPYYQPARDHFCMCLHLRYRGTAKWSRAALRRVPSGQERLPIEPIISVSSFENASASFGLMFLLAT
jgi:hypothetical protein